MQISINDKTINFPSSLSDITLGQRIEFHNEHVTKLDAILKEVLEMPDGFLKDLALQDYHDEFAMHFIAYFSGCSIDAIKEFAAADLVLTLYHTVYADILDEEANVELQSEFLWNDEVWHLQSPHLNQHHPMTFGELIDAKQVLKDLVDDNGSRWDLLLKVCCMFLRKPNESYNENLLEEEGERMKLMRSLPLDIAVAVGFFLTSSINLYKNTLVVSKEGKEEAEQTLPDTSINGDGFTS